MRRRLGNWLRSFIPPFISAAKPSGSYSAIGIRTNPVVASAWRSPRAVHNVRWGAIMVAVRRRRGPYSPKVHGTRPPWTLWDLYRSTTDKNSSSCLSIAIRGTPSLSPLAITPQAWWVKLSSGMLRHTSAHPAAFCRTAAANLWATSGGSSCTPSGFRAHWHLPTTQREMPSTNAVTGH